MTSSVLFKIVDEYTSWGKLVTPAINALLDGFISNYDPVQKSSMK